MAIDTLEKRSSAIGISLPWRCRLPVPDGSLDQGDRQQVAFLYRGVLAGAITQEQPGRTFRAHVTGSTFSTDRIGSTFTRTQGSTFKAR